ncbi:MAG: phosphopentomutase [bacterium]|nr:phosphopentomutase [bacterium]
MMRVLILVLDGVGCGEAPDAVLYNDVGSNTLSNLAKLRPLFLPNLQKLGLGNTTKICGVQPTESVGCWGILKPKSAGKDSTTGHWEIAGLITHTPFPVFPNGFPEEVIQKIREISQRNCIGNCVASGTEIIQRLGDEHIQSGALIVYTSADSVLQIAAHEEVVPLEELYQICNTIRNEFFDGPYAVGRVIARPFLGTTNHYYRTKNRHDWTLDPKGTTVLDELKKNGISVTSIGKVYDLFNGKGFTNSRPTKTNRDSIQEILSWLYSNETGIAFANLIDFDQLYGHRNDIEGFANALEQFDADLYQILCHIRKEDILIITSDHGNDPTTPSTDHSRECVPLLVFGDRIRKNYFIGIRETYADIAKTIADRFDISWNGDGTSFWKDIAL